MRKGMQHNMVDKKISNHTASISLGIMGAGFAATLPFSTGALGLLQGGFEAGLVGGLADWFAVTALFRHPLRIPIPHTAILPKNREKLTSAVISMVETELLDKDSISRKISEFHFVELFLTYIKTNIHSESSARSIAFLLERGIQAIPVQKVASLVTRELSHIMDQLDEKALVERLVQEIIRHQYDEKAFDYILDRAYVWAAQDETRFMLGTKAIEQIQQLKLNGLMQFALNAFLGYFNEEKMGDMIQSFLLTHITKMKQPDDLNRAKLMGKLQEELVNIINHPSVATELAQFKADFISSWNIEQKIEVYVGQLLERLLLLVRDESFVAERLIPYVDELIERLESNVELVQQIETWIQTAFVGLIEKFHPKIGELVALNLNKLDNDELIAFIEGKVGKDLQWIRVNGAVCGFLVGIVLTGLKLAIGS